MHICLKRNYIPHLGLEPHPLDHPKVALGGAVLAFGRRQIGDVACTLAFFVRANDEKTDMQFQTGRVPTIKP